MIVFENEGLIDVRAVKTFGVNVKEGDNPIGHFGTGLKYAIAILLRNKQKITLWRGTYAYKFTTAPTTIRNTDFQIVHMNGEPLGFTTEVGKNWEMWMAFRELWCNTTDENGTIFRTDTPPPEGVKGKTLIVVEGDKFETEYVRRSYTIVTTVPFLVGNDAEVHRGSSPAIFYRGIRVYDIVKPALYKYNLLSQHDLTEDRTLKYTWQAMGAIRRLILDADHENFLADVLTAHPDFYESGMNYEDGFTGPGETFLKVVGELRKKHKDLNINISALLLHRKHIAKSMLPEDSIKLNVVEQKQLDRARRFVKEILSADLDQYPLIVLESLGEGGLGRADMDEDRMYISKKCFQEGTKRVAAALYEEYVHLSERVRDESVEQKFFYLEKILSLGEQIQGEPL